MNKKKPSKQELIKMKSEEESIKVKMALRFTDEVLPDLKKPEYSSGEMTKGWSFNSYNMSVGKACSTSNSHSVWGDEKTTSQGGIDIFSTRILALKAMRHEVEMECAYNLRKIDIMIEGEIKQANKNK